MFGRMGVVDFGRMGVVRSHVGTAAGADSWLWAAGGTDSILWAAGGTDSILLEIGVVLGAVIGLFFALLKVASAYA